MNIITDILILLFIGVLYLQRAVGSPENNLPNTISVNDFGGSWHDGSIREGKYLEHFRLMPQWMHIFEKTPGKMLVYILLDSGAHFEGVLDYSYLDMRINPYRPRFAELHIEHSRSHRYYKSGVFGAHNIRHQPDVAGNPSLSYVYVKMAGGDIFEAVLEQFTPLGKEHTPPVQEDVGTFQPRKKIRTE